MLLHCLVAFIVEEIKLSPALYQCFGRKALFSSFSQRYLQNFFPFFYNVKIVPEICRHSNHSINLTYKYEPFWSSQCEIFFQVKKHFQQYLS